MLSNSLHCGHVGLVRGHGGRDGLGLAFSCRGRRRERRIDLRDLRGPYLAFDVLRDGADARGGGSCALGRKATAILDQLE